MSPDAQKSNASDSHRARARLRKARRFHGLQRGTAAFFHALVLAAVIAGLSLTIETWLWDTGESAWWSGLFCAGAGLLLAGTTWWKMHTLREAGTLYYLGGQAFGSSDDKEVHALTPDATKRHMDIRTVRRTIRVTERDEALDVVDWVKEFSAALETAVNEDSADTKFHFAVNLLFPLAFGVGQYSAFPRESLLLEVNHADEPDPKWSMAALQTPEPAEGVVGHTDHPVQPRSGPRVLSLLNGVGNDNFTCDVPHTRIGPSEPLRVIGDGKVGNGKVSAAPFTRKFALELLQFLRDHPEGLIFLRCRLLKTSTLALGWALADPARLGLEPRAWSDIYNAQQIERLVPVHYDQVSGRSRPVRIHAHQPSVDELAELWRSINPGVRPRESEGAARG